VLTSVHVEAAGGSILVVACPTCCAVLGTSMVGAARTDTRSRFDGASLAKTHPRRRQSVGGTGFAAVTANEMARRRATTVHQKVRGMLAARD
jgi:hypothetical protein